MDQISPLDKARELILSITSPSDATEEIARIEKLPESERSVALTTLYDSAEQKAYAGDTKGISIILRVCEHFGDRSHDRMLLHCTSRGKSRTLYLKRRKTGRISS